MSTKPPQMKVLLTVRTRSVGDDAIEALGDLDVEFHAATSVEEAEEVMDRVHLDHVIMGGGLDLESRLQIVRHVFESSNTTSVHMNPPTGPETYLPFVRAVLHGLIGSEVARPHAGTAAGGDDRGAGV